MAGPTPATTGAAVLSVTCWYTATPELLLVSRVLDNDADHARYSCGWVLLTRLANGLEGRAGEPPGGRWPAGSLSECTGGCWV